MSLQTRFNQLENDIAKQRELNKNWIMDNEWPTDDDYLYDTVPITFDTYQKATHWSKCRNPKNVQTDLFYALGLGGEVGELLNYIKKQYRNDGGEITEKRREQLFGEIGDCLYYLSALAEELDFKMSEIAHQNQKKMLIRLKEWEKSNE